MMNADTPLMNMLRELAYRPGKTTLSSGKESDFYIDCRSVFLRRDGMALCSRVLLETIREVVPSWGPVQFVAGTGLGGTVLCASLVMQSLSGGPRLNMIHVRDQAKVYGSNKRIECPSDALLGAGKDVLLIEDVVTTGASAIEAANALRSDWNVFGCLALVDRLEGAQEAFAEHHIRFKSVFSREDFLDDDFDLANVAPPAEVTRRKVAAKKFLDSVDGTDEMFAALTKSVRDGYERED